MLCIYCKADKSPSSFKKREHVIPQAFGKFIPDNLVLRNCVCDDCNQLFGDQIELFFGRDTFESIERLRHGMKPKQTLKHRRRTKSKIITGALKGVIVREKFLTESGHIAIEKAIQVGFYHKIRGEYDFFEIQDILKAGELLEAGYAIKEAQVWLIADEGEEMDKLFTRLKEQGIDIDPKLDMIQQASIDEIVSVETEITLDSIIMRGFCKIAFNYLAFVAGSDFVLLPEFDAIRRFIRYAEGDVNKYFAVNLPPILYDDQRLAKQNRKTTDGHLITIGWRKGGIVSKVSLFNTHTVGINLCTDFRGVWRPINSGHHFDVKTKQVSKLLTIPKTLVL